MDIKIEKTDKNTTLFIEANFDQIVAENFGNICEAMARRIKVLKELEAKQNESPIEIPELIETIRGCKNEKEMPGLLQSKFGISDDAVRFLLNNSLNEIDDNLNPKHLEATIALHEHEIQTYLFPLIS